MKKTISATLSAFALLALGACTDDAADSADDEVVTAEETTVINEAPDTMVTEGDMADGQTADDDRDSFSVSEDGVTADINDGDTSIRADVDDDPSLTVED